MILCFHEIGQGNSKYIISPEQFKKVLTDHPEAEIHFDDGRKGILKALPILKEFKRKATIFLVPNFLMKKATANECYSDFLTIEDVKELLKENVFEIGSHSLTHQNYLTKLDYFGLRNEIVESKRWLEDMFNKKITKFSYPFGAANEWTNQITERHYEKIYTLDNIHGIKRTLVINSANS